MMDNIVAILSISIIIILFTGLVFSNRRLSKEMQSRLQTEKTLLSEHNFAASIMERSPVIILLLNLDGTIKYVNPFFEQLSGFQLSEIKGKSWISTFLPECDQERIRQLFNRIVKDHQVDGNINTIKVRGEERKIEWYTRAMIDDEGATEGVLSIGLDVTDSQNSKMSLQLNETRLREAQRIAKVGNWELNLQTDDLYWSDEIYKIFDMDNNSSIASYNVYSDAIHPEDRKMVRETYLNSLSDEKPYVLRYRLKIGTKIKYVNEVCETFYDDNRKALRSVGTLQDVSDSVNAQMVIELNNARMHAIFESISDIIIHTDNDRVILSVNRMALQYFGYSESELIGNNVNMLYASEEIFEQEGKYRENPKILGSSDISEVHCNEYRRKDGTTFIGEGRGSHVILDSGENIGYVGIFRDITKRIHEEDELNNYRQNLEREVRLRTSHLISAREEADRANLAKSDFLSQMSHELRTPMNAILGFAQILELDKDLLNEIQISNVKEILEAGDHLLVLINDVLDLAKIESGKKVLNLKDISFTDVLEQSLSLIKPQFKNLNLHLINNVSKKNYRVKADSTALKQVLLNILSNAVKYNSVDGNIILDSKVFPPDRLRISFTDNGRGISEEDKAQLFTPFTRLNTSDNIEGTGIGLVITKNILELMDGNIGIENNIEAGCTFWIELAMTHQI